MPLAWVQVHSVVAHQDSNGCCRARAGTDLDPVLGERKLDAVAAIVDAEPQLFDLWRQRRVESEDLPAGAHAGEAAQHDVYRAGHRPEVDALCGGSALNVGDVALQRPL